jgi:hypothetical protein
MIITSPLLIVRAPKKTKGTKDLRYNTSIQCGTGLLVLTRYYRWMGCAFGRLSWDREEGAVVDWRSEGETERLAGDVAASLVLSGGIAGKPTKSRRDYGDRLSAWRMRDR